MKNFFLISILIALISTSYATYTTISPSEYSQYPKMPLLRDFGLQYILAEAMNEQKIPTATYEGSIINQVGIRFIGIWTYFEYYLTVQNNLGNKYKVYFIAKFDQEDRTLTIKLLVPYSIKLISPNSAATSNGSNNNQANNNGKPNANVSVDDNGNVTVNFTGQGNENENDNGHGKGQGNGNGDGKGTGKGDGSGNGNEFDNDPTYTPVPEEEFTNDPIQTLANFGKDQIVEKAVAENAIPSGAYVVTKIDEVARKILPSSTNYRFEIEIANSDGSEKVQANFIVNYEPLTQNTQLLDSEFEVL